MGFGWPLGLAALATLLVPILIHLARRRPEHPIRVGSLRHLSAGLAPRRARSRISEPWLLAARMLLLATLAAFLARPFIRRAPLPNAPVSLLLVPSALPEDSLRLLFPASDSLLAAGAELRRLPMADLWSEIAELDADLPDGSSLAVAAPLHLRVAGSRPAIRSTVSLHRLPSAASFALPARPRESLSVTIAADSSHRIAAERAAAAFRAVAELRGDSLVLTEGAALPVGESWIVWLADSEPTPAHLAAVRAGATLFTGAGGETAHAGGAVTIEPLARGRIITASWLETPSLDGSFPELIAQTWPEPSALAPTETAPRRISNRQLLPERAAPPRTTEPRTELGRALLAFAFVLFLLERWLAHRPARAPG